MDEKYLIYCQAAFSEWENDYDITLKMLKDNTQALHYMAYPSILYKMGMYNFLVNGNTKVTKLFFYKSVSGVLLNIKIMKGECKIDFNYSNSKTVVTDAMYTFSTAILSNSFEILLKCAKEIEDIGGFEERKTVRYLVNLAVKELILSDKNKSKEFINQAENRLLKSTTIQEIGYLKVIKGICETNELLVNEGLKLIIEWYRKNEEDKIKNIICFEATAFAKLAIDFGLNIDVSNKLINQDFFKLEDIVYEDIWEVKEALGIA